VVQAENERQSSTHEWDRVNAVAQCRDEMMRLLAASDVNSVPVDEQSIRQKYSEETRQIKVLPQCTLDVRLLIDWCCFFLCRLLAICMCVLCTFVV